MAWLLFAASISAAFSITICKGIDAPKIQAFNFPKNQQVGKKVVVSCVAVEGDEPMSFTWFKNGQPLTSAGQRVKSAKLTENMASLTILEVTAADIGNYTCVVSNSAGEDSFTAPLLADGAHPAALDSKSCVRQEAMPTGLTMSPASTVLAATCWAIVLQSAAAVGKAPKLQPFYFPKEPSLNMKVVFHCTVLEGEEPFKFVWYKDSLLVHPNQNIQVRTLSESLASLTILEVTAGDIGNYTCEVSNSAGKDHVSAELLVTAAPVWLSEPKDTDAVQGRDLVLACNAAGFPKPRFTWKMQIGSRDFVPLHPVGRRKIYDNGTLVIENVESDDEGLYQCDVSNGVAPPLSKTIKVSVHVPPRISKSSSDVSVKRGDIAKIACEATGQHPLVVTWEKDNTLLLPSVDRYETHEEMSATGVTSVLVIHNSVRKDATAYVCVAKNDYGQTKHTFRLTVLARGSVLQEQEVDGMRTSLMVTNLHPGTEYLALVLAENSVGFGDPSDTITFQTAAEEPSAPPMNIQCEALDTRNIKVSWEPPPADQLNGELKGYYIGHKMDGTPFVHDTVGRDTEHRTFRGLQAASTYRFMLKAFNEVGSGPASEEVTCTTLNG
ncbi:hypothetical protein V5799_018491, partial [Amblyomma americanum]